MKIDIKVTKEIEIKKVLMVVSPRSIGDDDDSGISPSFPFLEDGVLKLSICIDTGVVDGWPEGQEHSAFMKIGDTGSYYLIDEHGDVVGDIVEDYVPTELIPGEYGDYIDLQINGKGEIKNWPSTPDVSEFF